MPIMPAESEIQRRLQAERRRLEAAYGALPGPEHFRRPVERPFTAEQRGRVTILFGGLTWKHEELLRAVFEGAGYRCDVVPAPDTSAYQIGREHGNVGQCNPTYFTVGALIQYLRRLEAAGLSRDEIADRYVFFTSGTCGPCRFGMYESEYRLALQNAGFGTFRVLLFQQGDGVRAQTGEPGLKFTVDFGMGALNAVHLADAVHQLAYQIRPYEVRQGETDRATREVIGELARMLRERRPFELMKAVPRLARRPLEHCPRVRSHLNTAGKIREHLYGSPLWDALAAARRRFDSIDVDRLQIKPVVKIVGEFWAQTTESDGNFRIFAFLESEGAEVVVDPVGSWVSYLLFQARLQAARRRGLDRSPTSWAGWHPVRWLRGELRYAKKQSLLMAGERMWAGHYRRVADGLGGLAHALPPQDELARLAAPFFNPLARGGEGHLEIAKTLYHSVHHHCHMVLSLKPFGCMPSTQSDGAQSAVVARFPDILFLPVETAGDGEIHVRSRVQMALADAKARARREFEEALHRSGKRLEDIRGYVADHPQLRRALYRVPVRPGIAGLAANFVLHVAALMDGAVRSSAAGLVRRPERSASCP
jgi:predicted nucleotide-binding protein (sugar kinase/HSP70/actin superfamily)